MNILRFIFLSLALAGFLSMTPAAEPSPGPVVYIIPIRDDIMTPMTYLVRRGVKAAMEAKADALIIDMETNGGRVDSTEEIIESLSQFQGKTATFVDRKAFSAGAFIAVSTQKIFMAPQSVIGAAAPIMMAPGGGAEGMPETMEAKMTSGIRALVRTSAEKNGYNVEVVEAMIDKTRRVEIDGEVLNEKGQILTLTNVQAEKEYGDPPKPLLSSGTVASMEEVLKEMGLSGGRVVRVEATGAEKLASFITAFSPLLMLIGIVGIYIEMKTPGFGIPGIIGLVAFGLYFAGGFIAGLSGFEWLVVFVIGLALFILELFFLPGTLFFGITGGLMMLAALVMAMVDVYPGMPGLPSFGDLQGPLLQVLVALALAVVLMAVLSRYLLKTQYYSQLVSHTASGVTTVARENLEHSARIGEVGVAISTLRPGGKARFKDDILDVITQGQMVPKGKAVRILSFSSHEAVVEPVEEDAPIQPA